MSRPSGIDWSEALRLLQLGWTHGRIALALGCGKNTVGHGLRALSVRTQNRWKRRHSRHGIRLYAVWNHLQRRCSDPANRGYEHYGSLGIRMARAWDDFDVFYDWAIAAGFAPGLKLVRVDRARHFTPANCRWSTEGELQSRPRQGVSPFLITAFGESKGQLAWARDPRCRVKQPALRDRLKSGWPPEEAIAAPVGSRPSHYVRPPARLLRPRERRARIDWDEVRRLYLKEHLSEAEIARRFNATEDAVRRGLGRYAIPRRSRPTPTLHPEWERLNQIWRNLLARAKRRSGPARVRVTPEWREFERFYAWARASGSKKGRWLTRKNRRWAYSPANCEWVSRTEATRRRRAAFPGSRRGAARRTR